MNAQDRTHTRGRRGRRAAWAPFAWLMLVGAFACGRTAEPEAHTKLRELPVADRGQSFTVEQWLDRPTLLEVVTDGNGSGRVEWEDDAGGRRQLLSIDTRGSVELASEWLDVPTGTAVRLHFEAEAGVEWRAARLSTKPEPAAPEDYRGRYRGQDVVVFVTDALFAQHMSCYGNVRATTPNLDALAARGTLFEAAYSQTSWTLPSVATLFTGLEQERHGLQRRGQVLAEPHVTLAERFREAGYRTVGLIQNGVVWNHTELDQGFDRYELFRWSRDQFEALVAEALRTLGEDDDRPLFLYVHMIPPHGPIHTPDDFREVYDAAYTGEVDGSVQSAVRINQEHLASDHPDVVHLVALYDEYLRYADDRIGDIVAAIDGRKGERETLMLHTSDHGEAFMQHGFQGHCLHVFEEMVRVPLILAATDGAVPKRRVAGVPVSLLDVHPTLVELCDLAPADPTLSGVSLARWFGGAQPGRTRPLFLTSRYRDADRPKQVGVLLGGYKLVRWDTLEGPRVELFDLASDPLEQTDIAANEPVRAAVLEDLLDRWLAASELDRQRRMGDAPAGEAELSETVLEQMRALGYLGADESSDEGDAQGSND